MGSWSCGLSPLGDGAQDGHAHLAVALLGALSGAGASMAFICASVKWNEQMTCSRDLTVMGEGEWGG